MTVFIYEPDADDEPTLWALERGDTDQYQYTGLLSRCNLAPHAQRFWPDVVARMTGTVLTNDDTTIERIAQAVCRSENSGELTNWDIYRDLWMHHARAILTDLTGGAT